MTEEAAAAVIKALEPSLQRMQGQMEKVKMFKQVLGVSCHLLWMFGHGRCHFACFLGICSCHGIKLSRSDHLYSRCSKARHDSITQCFSSFTGK